MSKRIKAIVIVLITIVFAVSLTIFVLYSCKQRYKQWVYKKVVRQLIAVKDYKTQQLYQALVKNKVVKENEIQISVGFFFEKMTRQVTGERIRVALPTIKPKNFQAVNTILSHMLIIEKSRAWVNQFSATSQAELIRYLHQKVLQYYENVLYDEDRNAIESLLNNGDNGIKIKILFPTSGQIMATFF